MRVYLGSYTSAGGGGIGVGEFADGRLTIERWIDTVPDPSWLAIRDDTLYAANELDPHGTVSALRLPDLTVLNTVPTGSAPAHLALSPSGERLFASLYGSGAVAEHPLLPDGRVGPARLHKHAPDGAHAHQFVPDPSGRWALVPDLGLDAVVVYALDHAGLREHARVRLEEGTGPRHLVFSGDRVYVAGELNSTVTVCTWSAGDLAPIATTDTRLPGATGPNHPGGIALSPDRRFVYVGNRGDNTTAVLAAGRDELTLVAAVSCGGDWPRDTAVDPSGEWLFSANQRSGDVAWFALDPATGVPAPAGHVAARAVSHVLFA